MTSSLLVMWLALLPGFALGYVGHELAHYAVLRVCGRDDGLSLWPPRAKLVTPAPVPLDVRVAAVAPALVGLGLVAAALLASGVLGLVGWGLVIGACSRLFHLSPADRQMARGRVAE